PRLACLRHAASVRSEPGSNSPLKLSVTTVSRAQRAQNGWTDRKFKEIGQASDPLRSPAAQLKACTTIQFSKTSPLGANRNIIARLRACQRPSLPNRQEFPTGEAESTEAAAD